MKKHKENHPKNQNYPTKWCHYSFKKLIAFDCLVFKIQSEGRSCGLLNRLSKVLSMSLE